MKLQENQPPARESEVALEARAVGSRVSLRWSADVHARVNYADEDLWLLVRQAAGQQVLSEEKVNHLAQKDVAVAPDTECEIMLLRRERPRVSVATSMGVVPRVVIIAENPGRHHVTWAEIDWPSIDREVGLVHQVSFARDCEVVLDLERWPGDPGLTDRERLFPGLNDYALVLGAIKRMDFAVVHRQTGRPLKTLFTLAIEPQKTSDVLGHVRFHTPAQPQTFLLVREASEETAVHLRARWDVEADGDLHLLLWDLADDAEVQSGERPVVGRKGDWLFRNVRPARSYEARLVRPSGAGRQAVAASPTLVVPERPAHVTLLPIDSWHTYCYWHLDDEAVVRDLVARHRTEPHRIQAFVRVFSEFEGRLHHHMEMDFGFHMGHTRDWFMSVQPDKVYRVQVIAMVDGWKLEELTPLSNPAQTGREHPGQSPVSFREVAQPVAHPTLRSLGSVRGTTDRSLGLLILHLHAHMPFMPGRINYGTTGFWRPGGYPEEWYHEAVRGTYIPLIETFDRLIDEGVDFKMSLDLSPPVTSMMQHPVHQAEFLKYIENLIVLARAEVERTRREEPWFTAAATMHLNDFLRCRDVFLGYGRDLTAAFRKFQDAGVLEISTCAATHGFLPLWNRDPAALRSQLRTAVLDYERVFGRRPNGVWLPECAYTPGLEKPLQDEGLRYFFSETETVNQGDSHAEFTWHAPVYVRGSDVAVFPRDYETGRIVWSADEGYPGDPDYLEFHIRGGPFKYNRITDRKSGRWKQPYNPEWAQAKAAKHAQHFMENRNFRFEYLRGRFFKKPLSVACYDAELFGHHWYEGPLFLYYLLKKLYYDQNQTELTTPSHYLSQFPKNQEMFPNTSSWGEEGTFKKWMGGDVVWIYRQGQDAVREMMRIAAHLDGSDDFKMRVVRQAGRELLLAMNSDVPFVISNGHFVDRMREMTQSNLQAFWRLASIFWTGPNETAGDAAFLSGLEYEHPMFPNIDPRAWKT